MIFVDDIITIFFLIVYLITVFRGHTNGGIALLAIIFSSIMAFHLNRLINHGIKQEEKN